MYMCMYPTPPTAGNGAGEAPAGIRGDSAAVAPPCLLVPVSFHFECPRFRLPLSFLIAGKAGSAFPLLHTLTPPLFFSLYPPTPTSLSLYPSPSPSFSPPLSFSQSLTVRAFSLTTLHQARAAVAQQQQLQSRISSDVAAWTDATNRLQQQVDKLMSDMRTLEASLTAVEAVDRWTNHRVKLMQQQQGFTCSGCRSYGVGLSWRCLAPHCPDAFHVQCFGMR
ncbi:unnamed protein product [Closterium sp. NIES-54]